MGSARTVGLIAGRAYRAVLLTLLVTAMVPAMWGWSASLVRTGSMTPSVGVGDVVVTAPVGDHRIRAGQVVTFDRDPRADVESLVMHRVHSVGEDGTLTTRGDANRSTDAAPVRPDSVRGVGVLLVPYVGLPLHWWATGAWLSVLGWAVATAVLLHLAVDPARRTRPRKRLRRRTRLPGVPSGPVAATAAVLAVAAASAVVATAPTVDAAFTARTSNSGASWQAAHPYVWAVRADKPTIYYPLDETGGSVARDVAGYGLHGTIRSVAAYAQPGATPRNPGTSVRFAGGGGRIVAGGPASLIPSTFSIEMWFRTTSTQGGKLVGFESTRDAAASPKYDRHVFIGPDGRLVYGAWKVVSEPTILLTSPQSYHDGQWHHLVLTGYVVSGSHRADMFVDGAQVASGPVTSPSDYYGWWRAGYGGLPTGAGYPETADFHGQLDNVAGYTTRLSAARVKAHYDAR